MDNKQVCNPVTHQFCLHGSQLSWYEHHIWLNSLLGRQRCLIDGLKILNIYLSSYPCSPRLALFRCHSPQFAACALPMIYTVQNVQKYSLTHSEAYLHLWAPEPNITNLGMTALSHTSWWHLLRSAQPALPHQPVVLQQLVQAKAKDPTGHEDKLSDCLVDSCF